MKWLHLSDLHYNPLKDGTDTNNLRGKLKDFLIERNVQVDVIFLTGDYRDASSQIDSDEYAKGTAVYIKEIAEVVGIHDVSSIFCIPGNHDLERNYSGRRGLICMEKQVYRPDKGEFLELHQLLSAFTFYKRILLYLYGREYSNLLWDSFESNPHLFTQINNSSIGILSLNTELLAGEIVTTSDGKDRVDDAGTLLLGSKYLLSILSDSNHCKIPTIAIGHRGLELLDSAEQRKVINIFRDYNVCLYLCGHCHDLWIDNSRLLPQINVGCIKSDDGIKAGFCIGEYLPEVKKFEIQAFAWDNNTWNEYNHFSDEGSSLSVSLDYGYAALSDQFRNKINIVIDGRVRSFRCKVPEGGMKHWENHSSIMSVIAGELYCIVQNNEYTEHIKFGQTFILSSCVWKVIGIDNTTVGITKLTCKKELKRGDDDFVKCISHTSDISTFNIELLAPIDCIGIGQTLKLTPVLIRDSKVINNALFNIGVSNDIVLENNGDSITGKLVGKCDVNIVWQEDPEVATSFLIEVVDLPVSLSNYRVYKVSDDLSEKSYSDFSVISSSKVRFGIEKYIDCDQILENCMFYFAIIDRKSGENVPVLQINNHEIDLSTAKIESGGKYTLQITGEFSTEIDFEGEGWL